MDWQPGYHWVGFYLDYAPRVGLDWRWMLAQMIAESAGNPDAASGAGAVGLTQFMSRTWLEWFDGTPGIQWQNIKDTAAVLAGRRDPVQATRRHCDYMAWLLRQPGVSDMPHAFAAYNWGLGNIQRTFGIQGITWRSLLPLETQQYLQHIERSHMQVTTELVPELQRKLGI